MQTAASLRVLHRLPILFVLLFIPLATVCAQDDYGGVTFSVYFPTNIATLSNTAQKTLDSLVYRGAIRPGQRLTITGYADEPGTAALNNSLSQRRAKAVADYLTRDGFIRREDIAAVSGRGYNAANAGRGENPRFRRASITVRDGPPALPRPTPVAPPPVAKPTTSPLARLDTAKVNTTLPLDAVLFENHSDVVLPSSHGQLQELLVALRNNPTLRIRLEGHVCCGNSPEYGQYISDIRAKAVYDYLVRNGVSPNRLTHQGFGFSRPLIYPETSEDDRRLNRRVEVRVLGK